MNQNESGISRKKKLLNAFLPCLPREVSAVPTHKPRRKPTQTAQVIATRQQAVELLEQQQVPWQHLKKIGQELQSVSAETDGPWLHQTCQGISLILPTPPPRIKSKELQDRLAVLQKNAEQASYNKMVSEVTKAELKAEALKGGALRTFKQQISFGLHVLVMMGTFYVFGHVAGAAISNKRAACGMGGLVIAMLLETVLLIIRTTSTEQFASKGQQQQSRQHALHQREVAGGKKKRQ